MCSFVGTIFIRITPSILNLAPFLLYFSNSKKKYEYYWFRMKLLKNTLRKIHSFLNHLGPSWLSKRLNPPSILHWKIVCPALLKVTFHCIMFLLPDFLLFSSTASSNPSPVPCNPLFISKWIDYTRKYGFGFQLSDRSVGVLFNDGTRISYSRDRR